jgi:hypothetical protein
MITRGHLVRLYPNRATAERLHEWAGAQRFLWNRLLDAVKAEYERSGNFLWKRELSRASPLGCRRFLTCPSPRLKQRKRFI